MRMLGYVLGVAPGEFGLVPDEQGWVSIKELIKALNEQEGWRGVRASMVRDAASRLAPDELELNEGRVRSLSRKPPRPRYGVEPPTHLYLGVRPRTWPVIQERGLVAGESGPVVLHADEEEALRRGKRKDPDPVLVTVQAQRATEQGVVFATLGERLYLCDWVPPDCLMGPPIKEKPPEKKPPRFPKEEKQKGPFMPAADAMPGSFTLTFDDVDKPYKRKGLKKEISWKDQRRKDRRKQGRRDEDSD